MNFYFLIYFLLLVTSSLTIKNDLPEKPLSKAMQFKLMQMIEILNKEKAERFFFQKSKEPAFKNKGKLTFLVKKISFYKYYLYRKAR
jgi:hypothetical protein